MASLNALFPSLLFLMLAVFGRAGFTVSTETYRTGTDQVTVKILKNTENGEEFRTVVDCGGRIDELWLMQSGKLVSVLANHQRNATAIRANEHWKGGVLLPYANRIKNGTYFFDNETHYLPINEPDRDNAIHGLLINKTMSVVDSSETHAQATVVLGYQFDGTDPGYPFHLYINLTYTLSSTGFMMTITAYNKNPNHRPLPFFFGCHPYFLVSDVSKATVTFDNCTRWGHVEMSEGAPRDGNLIPTGVVTHAKDFIYPRPIGGTRTKPTYFDDEYVALDSCDKCSRITQRIHDTVTGHRFRLWQDKNFRFSQIFTGSMELWNLSAIALEPMSAEADAYNNHHDLTVLSSEEMWEGKWGISG